MARKKNLEPTQKGEPSKEDIERAKEILQKASEGLDEVLEILQELEVSPVGPQSFSDSPILLELLGRISTKSQATRKSSVNMEILAELHIIIEQFDASSYEGKKLIAQSIRDKLKEYGMSIGVAVEDNLIPQPHTIYALDSKDGSGRFILEDRRTKKRVGVQGELYTQLKNARFVESPDRVEAFSKRRVRLIDGKVVADTITD